MALWRIEAVKAETGHRSHASIYTQIREGLFTKPVPIGARAVGWPSDEVEMLIRARVAGQCETQIRDLVIRLHGKRAEQVALLLGGAGA